MLLATYTTDKLLWISSSMAGFSVGPLSCLPTLWMSDYIEVTGTITGCLVIACGVGTVAGPTLAGYLFDNMSHMWFVYLGLGASLLEGALCVVMIVFVAIFVKSSKKPDVKRESSII